jgi:hypothetical protein
MVSKNFTPAAGCATSALREAQKSRAPQKAPVALPRHHLWFTLALTH